jgi:hypothetical protein
MRRPFWARTYGTWTSQPTPAHKHPLAINATPAIKSAVSRRVSSQLLRILHLNYWTVLEQTVSQAIDEWLKMPWALCRRPLGDNWAPVSRQSSKDLRRILEGS